MQTITFLTTEELKILDKIIPWIQSDDGILRKSLSKKYISDLKLDDLVKFYNYIQTDFNSVVDIELKTKTIINQKNKDLEDYKRKIKEIEKEIEQMEDIHFKKWESLHDFFIRLLKNS